MFVYVITASGYSKIGIAANPKRRMADLQVANPKVLRLRYTREIANKELAGMVEQLAHGLLQDKGVEHRGEWFRVPWEVAGRAISDALRYYVTSSPHLYGEYAAVL